MFPTVPITLQMDVILPICRSSILKSLVQEQLKNKWESVQSKPKREYIKYQKQRKISKSVSVKYCMAAYLLLYVVLQRTTLSSIESLVEQGEHSFGCTKTTVLLMKQFCEVV